MSRGTGRTTRMLNMAILDAVERGISTVVLGANKQHVAQLFNQAIGLSEMFFVTTRGEKFRARQQ